MTTGEVASAVSAIVGALIGALGAAAAVYLTIKAKHDEEANRIRSAILREVIEFCRFATQNLETCAEAHRSDAPMSLSEFISSMDNPEPIIYRVIADRIGLTRTPQEIVSFYARFHEVAGYVKAAEKFLASRMKTADAANLLLIGETLVEVLSFGKRIIEGNDENGERLLEGTIQHAAIRQVDYAIDWGSRTFP